MAAYFITGTGTDIGKTWLSAALLRHWRAAGHSTQALKPVMSGVDAHALAQSDAGQLLLAQGLPVSAETVAAISPWCFAAPLSPDMAAAAEGRAIDYAELLALSRRPTAADFSLIEGVGGVMVPLDAQHTVLDWMSDLALPVILVAGSYLGSMSHTLTALLALHSRQLHVAAIVINETPGASVALSDTVASLRRHCAGVAVVAIERDHSEAGIASLAAILRPS